MSVPRSICKRVLEFEVRGLAPGIVGRITEIINQMMRKFKLTFFKEPFPSDPFGPFARDAHIFWHLWHRLQPFS